MLQAKVTSVVSLPLADADWEDGECLCESDVQPADAIDYLNRVFRERDGKWVWKVAMRLHKDCPIHGCHRPAHKDA